MHGKASGTLIVVLLTIYGGAEALNFTQLLRRRLDPEVHQQRKPCEVYVTRDISYLPEEDYMEEYQAESEKLQKLQRDDRSLMPKYRNLCEIVTRKIRITDDEYEYQPDHYYEVFCKNYSLLDDSERAAGPVKQKCAHPGFHCVQRSRTLFMVRRRWDGECWEPFTKEIASGCDCMWPVNLLGDITMHY